MEKIGDVSLLITNNKILDLGKNKGRGFYASKNKNKGRQQNMSQIWEISGVTPPFLSFSISEIFQDLSKVQR